MNNIVTTESNNGFFSCCTSKLRQSINFFNQTSFLPTIDSSNLWGGYKDYEGDITEKFFKLNNEFKFNIEPFIFTSSPQEDQFSDYSLINYESINFFLKKYFSLSDEVEEIKSKLISKYDIDLDTTLSVYYRGNDKVIETNIPTYEEFLDIINLKIKKDSIKKVLIQSDEKEFYDFISDRLENLIIIDEIIKPNRGNFNNQHVIPTGQKCYHAQLFLSIIYLISQSKSVIMNSCNTSMWISLFRGNTKNVSQYLNPKEYIYGIKNENFCEYRFSHFSLSF
jgi:hypothetical protein